MNQIMEEYGMFLVEVIAGSLLLGLMGYLFFDVPLYEVMEKFILGLTGGVS